MVGVHLQESQESAGPLQDRPCSAVQHSNVHIERLPAITVDCSSSISFAYSIGCAHVDTDVYVLWQIHIFLFHNSCTTSVILVTWRRTASVSQQLIFLLHLLVQQQELHIKFPYTASKTNL